MVKELSVVGKGLPLKDAHEKVTGSIKFTVDISLSGMLYAKVLRSPYAHARIIRIETSKAELLPGVEAIITHRDVPEEEWIGSGMSYLGRVLDERVRFVGDEVAVVAAVNKYVAEEALNLIEVEYEELPHVFDVEKAMDPDAPLVSPHGNVRPATFSEWGDIDKGFGEADLVVEHRTRLGNVQHAPLGRNACIASWEGEKVTIWASTQAPFQLRDELARFLKMPQNRVRVIGLPTGPSQGLWYTNNFHFITVLLAKKARKPVKLELTQEESFATVKRKEKPLSWGKLGVKRDGSFTAIHFKHYFDNGAYGVKNNPFESVSDLWGGKTPHGRFEFYGVSTNLLTAGCMRGVGDVTVGFCMEQLIDKAAEELGIDPLEIRLKNHIRAGDPLHSYSDVYNMFGVPIPALSLSSCGLEECIKKGAEAIGWRERWQGWGKPAEINGTKRRGLGMAVACHICGEMWLGCSSVIVEINHDGSIHLLTGVACMGQGVETTQAQIAAEELGVSIESIVGTHGDTETCPWCVPTVASISAHHTGLATQAAAADAKRQLCELASRDLGVPPNDLDIKNGIIYVLKEPDKGIPINIVTAKFLPEFLAPPAIIGRAWSNVPLSPIAKMFMAHFVEVEVDTDTGEVEIVRYVAVHDSGKIINPQVCDNQVAGGVLLGCGFGLVEDLIFDDRTGRILNPNYMDYKILTALDIPDPEISYVEVIDPVGAFGIKGIGEGPPIPPPAAIAQAIHNAIGIRLDAPITPEKILRALKSSVEKGQV